MVVELKGKAVLKAEETIEKKSNAVVETKANTSGLCRGYDLGVSCIACCTTYHKCYMTGNSCSLDETLLSSLDKTLLSIVEAPILLKVYDNGAIIKSKRPIMRTIHIGLLCGVASKYINIKAVDNTYSDFNDAIKIFYSELSKNTAVFEEKLQQGIPMQEIALSNDLLGWSDTDGTARIGCLLYDYENPITNVGYRPTECNLHLCGLAFNDSEQNKNKSKIAEQDFKENHNSSTSSIKNIITEFINRHSGDNRLNSLSYSKLIHLIDQHPDVVELLGMQVLFYDETKNECLMNMERLFRIVTK